MTYCEICNDSGEVEAKVQHQDRPTAYVSCLACPRCTVCDCLIHDCAGPGKIGDEWVCSPECGALVFTGDIATHYAPPADLIEASHCLEIQGRSLTNEREIRDFGLLARVVAHLAMGQSSKAYYLNTARTAAESAPGIKDIPDFLRSIVEQGGAA